MTIRAGLVRVAAPFVVPVAMQGMTMTCPGCHDMIIVPSADMDASDNSLPRSAGRFPPIRWRVRLASDDASEKLAYRIAYIAAGSVGLLAVAMILTSLFHSIARVLDGARRRSPMHRCKTRNMPPAEAKGRFPEFAGLFISARLFAVRPHTGAETRRRLRPPTASSRSPRRRLLQTQLPLPAASSKRANLQGGRHVRMKASPFADRTAASGPTSGCALCPAASRGSTVA